MDAWVVGAVLGLVGVVLLALLVNLFRQLTRLALAAGIVLAFLVVGVIVVWLMGWPTSPMVVHPGPPASMDRPDTRPGPGAATAVTGFLLAVVMGLVMAIGMVVLGREWWRERQRQARLREALQQAQLYALLGGERQPVPLARPRMPQGGGNVIVIGGQQAPPRRDVPIAFPPADAGNWEVIE